MLHLDFILTLFSVFGKLIWIYYSKPKLIPWGALFGQRCQLCETLMKRKVWGSFFGAQGAHFCDLGRKKLPQALRFIRFERKWRPWTPRARKSSIWTTNSKPKLIFLKTRILKKSRQNNVYIAAPNQKCTNLLQPASGKSIWAYYLLSKLTLFRNAFFHKIFLQNPYKNQRFCNFSMRRFSWNA